MDELMKKFTRIVTFVSLMTLLGSCANLSKNSVKEGELVVRNGIAGSQKWYENLSLKRVSWLHELTLQFDLIIGNVSPQSGFNFWFSKEELEVVNKCADFRVVLAYSQDTKIIPYSYLNEQLEQAGFKKIDLIHFKKHFLQHPDAEMNSLRLYQLYGVCRAEKLDKPLIFNFPGFSEKSIN